MTPSPTSFHIRELVRQGRLSDAKAAIVQLLSEECALNAVDIRINDDPYSLNSVNGFVTLADGAKLFFKFHAEEGEEGGVSEYYRAGILSKFGLPVDLPLHAVTKPGRQVLLYRFRQDAKLADVCLALERGQTCAFNEDAIVLAQRRLDEATFAAASASLAPPSKASAGTALHQLFYHRLVDKAGDNHLGGRYRRFYQGQMVRGPGFACPFEDFERLSWVINGVTYRKALREMFEESLRLLDPWALSRLPMIAGHGDAHNANVWVETGEGGAPRLVSFDPAFASDDLPVLLAEIKSTFHNVFAHPFWLYTPQLAETAFTVKAVIRGKTIEVEHDWELSGLRRKFLDMKIEVYWRPLLRRLKRAGSLPENFEDIMRAALFCCPTLVMNLLPSAARPPKASLIGFAVALMAGSPPLAGGDVVSDMFAKLRDGL